MLSHVFAQPSHTFGGGGGGAGGEGETRTAATGSGGAAWGVYESSPYELISRVPQSVQSVPYAQSAPRTPSASSESRLFRPPSWQTPSLAALHVSAHTICTSSRAPQSAQSDP